MNTKNRNPHILRPLFLIVSIINPLGMTLSAQTSAKKDRPPLIAYVGTYTSPLKNMLSTQVDLPPGNGRGIHLFQVDRATGALSAHGVYEMSTSPSALALNADGTRLKVQAVNFSLGKILTRCFVTL